MYRQGDILLIPTDEQFGQEINEWDGVVAEGEATGHHHRFVGGGIRAFTRTNSGPRRPDIVELTRPACLRHEEHDPISVPAGRYKIGRQKQWAGGQIVRVAD